MKKIILLATISVAGLVSAKTKEAKYESKKVFYYPVTITSSCGYTQTIEVIPGDDFDCWIVDSNQMEEECSAPFTNPILA